MDESRRCSFCGNEITDEEGSVTMGVSGVECGHFCSTEHWTKFVRKTVKTMSFKTKADLTRWLKRQEAEYQKARFAQLLKKDELTEKELSEFEKSLSRGDRRTLVIIGLVYIFRQTGGNPKAMLKEIRNMTFKKEAKND